MALPSKTLDEVVQRVTGYFRTSFEGLPLGSKKFLGRMARSMGLSIWGLQKAVEDLDKDIVPSPQMSDDVLSEWAALLGLPDGQGGLGRLLAVPASGGVATLTGVKGTSYTDGITATAEDGTTQIALSGAVAIPGSPPGFGSVSAQFVAVTAGSAGNLPIGTVCNWDSPPAGADGSFVLTSPLSDGLDLESNPAVYARIVSRLQTPPRGGVAEDFREWLAAVTGVVRTYVYPKRSGTGTVDAVIVGGGSGQARVPSASVQIAAQTELDANVPVGAEEATALLPYAPDDAGHLVVIEVEPAAARFDFDWDDRTGPFTVDTYAAGSPATIKLNAVAPATLKAAVDAYIANTGLKPRLQVLSSGSVINIPIGVVAYDADLSQTTLTLETLPDTWVAPVAGDAVYAYGPVVATIAAGSLALCDALGPSRVSGFADAITPWSDKLTISGLTAVAEDAIDSDGTELIAEVAAGGITIDGVAADVRGTDGANGPELLYLSHVAVVRAP